VPETIAHYTILEKLGSGGMGAVFRAHDTRLGRDVALKLLPAELFADPEARARLVREARLAPALNHPNVCTIHEVGDADGQTYLAMELVRGRPLRGATREVKVDRTIGIAHVSWAANGRGWIVVGAEMGAGWQLLSVDAKGRSRALIPPQQWMYSAAASPDGRSIAFTSNTVDGNIWLLEDF
jgi:hypothetical protein